MPMYEYECSDCKIVVETFKKSSSDQQFNCPQCGKDMKKLISGCTFVKGPGSWSGNNFQP